MVAIQGGAWSATLLVGLVLVMAAHTAMAGETTDRDLMDLMEDRVVGDPVTGRALDLPAAADRPTDRFALWLSTLTDDTDSDHGLDVRVDEPVDTPQDVAQDAPEQAERVVARTEARVQDGLDAEEQEQEGSQDDGQEDDEATGSHGPSSEDGQDDPQNEGGGNDPSLQSEVCKVAWAVCDAPAATQLVPELPSDPSVPGLPVPGLPSPPESDGVDDVLAGDDDRSSLEPQGASVEGTDQGPGLGVALAAAAATAVVAAVVATTATGSMGSLAAWLARVLAGAKGFFLSLYARLKRDKVLDHGTRKELFLFLQANPGACITKIQRVLGTSLSTTRHHLETLRSHGLVVDVKSGRKRCFFTREDGMSPKARTATAALTSKAARRVYRQIEDHPGIGQQELADALRVSRTSVIFHVRRLRDAGVVRQGQQGRQVVYHPVEGASSGNGATDVAPSLFNARAGSPTPDFSS